MTLTDLATVLEESNEPAADIAQLPVIVSLFAGAGGLDLGFRQAGFKVGFATDISESAMRTHNRNFPGAHTVVADLLELGAAGLARQIADYVPQGSRIGIIGGPPCQGFSYGNPASRADDPRNQLARVYVQVVAALSENYIVDFTVFENVPGLKSSKHKRTFDHIKRGLRATGLTVSELTLSATDFGVPQTRKRVLLIGIAGRGNRVREIPSVNENPRLTVDEAIGRMVPPVFYRKNLDPSSFPLHANHWTMRPVSKRFQDPIAAGSTSRSFRRLKWDSPSPTIAFGHREIHVHPSGTRRLSIYEAMLLQGFPSWFVLEGTLSQQTEQISNAVPPPLAESVATVLRNRLQGEMH